MQALKSLLSMVGLVGVVGTSAYLLLQMRRQGWIPAPGDLFSVTPEEAIYGAVWLLAIAFTMWLGVTTLLSVAAYSTRLPSMIRAVEWMTLPPIRRLARRTAAVLLAVSSLTVTGAAGAAQIPPIPLVVNQPSSTLRIVDHEQAARSISTPALIPTVSGSFDSAPEGFHDALPAGIRLPLHHRLVKGSFQGETVEYRVEAGDNLWSITAEYMSRYGDRTPTESAITRLWQEVIDLNRNRIRSGDPDLIFPGETILLPTVRDVN